MIISITSYLMLLVQFSIHSLNLNKFLINEHECIASDYTQIKFKN